MIDVPSVANAIIEYATKQHIDLIIMGTRGGPAQRNCCLEALPAFSRRMNAPSYWCASYPCVADILAAVAAFHLHYYGVAGPAKHSLPLVVCEYPPEDHVQRKQESLAKALDCYVPAVGLVPR